LTGRLITFEGPDGAGKTTQIRLLEQALAELGIDAVRTREPGGTRISDLLRAILLDPEHREMSDQAEILLYAAARAQHVQEKILPALAEGKVVLCDRFIDASMAYQAYGLNQDPEAVMAINRFAASGLRPDRTYMLDIPVETSLRRLRERSVQQGGGLDRIEQKQVEYHERVRTAFLHIAAAEKDRVCLIDADRPPEAIAAQIWDDCRRLLQQAGA